MFADRMSAFETELDNWRYEMMGQTMLIRNSEGDYSPAHRSLLKFFAAYKIVALLGAMAEDLTEVAKQQSYVSDSLPSQEYSWKSYFKEAVTKRKTISIAALARFRSENFDLLSYQRKANSKNRASSSKLNAE